jgi:hypothetical protein
MTGKSGRLAISANQSGSLKLSEAEKRRNRKHRQRRSSLELMIAVPEVR